MSVKGAQGRWKNIVLTVYLICPLALFTGLCWWAMVSLQQRVENTGRMREQAKPQPERGVDESAPEAATDDDPSDEASRNRSDGQDESGG